MKKLLIPLCLGISLNTFHAPANASADPLLGEVMWTAANFCPRGWGEANGQLLPVNTNQSLFSLLGTNFGGDGRTTFGLPDLRGRVSIGDGTGSGLSTFRVGERGGVERVTLNTTQIPSHTHGSGTLAGTVVASNQAATTEKPEGNMLADSQRAKIYSATPVDPANEVDMAAGKVKVTGTIGNTGGNLPHENRPPFLAMKACIALVGTFPSRN